MNDRTIIKSISNQTSVSLTYFWKRNSILSLGRRKSQLSSVETSAKATNTFVPVQGIDKIDVEGITIQIRTQLYNICTTAAHENKSPEVRNIRVSMHSFNCSFVGTSI